MILLASDFDDTLYFHDGRKIRLADVQAIKDLQKKNHLFVLCTGRPYSMRQEILEKIQGRFEFDYEIYSCGSVIADGKGQILHTQSLPDSFVRDALKQWPGFPFLIHHEKGMYSNKREAQGAKTLLCPEDLPEGDVYEMSVSLHEPKSLQVLADLRKHEGADCYSNKNVADFVSCGTSKATGIDWVARLVGTPVYTAAIGDSFNDIPMLQGCRTGFTFHGSEPSVKEAADAVCDGIQEAVPILLDQNDAQE